MDLVRGAAFIGALLLAWMTLHPFVDLGDQQLKDPTSGNEATTYLAFGGLAVLTAALAMRDNIRGLATLLTPAYLLFGGWIVVTVVLSQDPGTSVKRLALTACVIAVTATLPAAGENPSRADALVQHRRAALAGGLLPRNIAGAEPVYTPRDRCPGAATGGKLAGGVRPQERGGVGDGDAGVSRHLHRPLRRMAVRDRHRRAGVAVPAQYRRQDVIGADLPGAGADLADVARARLPAARGDAVDPRWWRSCCSASAR